MAAGNPVSAGIFLFGSLAVGIFCKNLLRGTRLPYTVLLLLFGLLIGVLNEISS